MNKTTKYLVIKLEIEYGDIDELNNEYGDISSEEDVIDLLGQELDYNVNYNSKNLKILDTEVINLLGYDPT